MRMDVLEAWRQLHRIRREEAHLRELPVAQLIALTANINRDSKKVPRAFALKDFTLFAPAEREEAELEPEVSAVALALRHEGKAPPMLIAVWPQILTSLKAEVKAPATRVLVSEDERVWVLAPRWEGANCRGGLVLVSGRISGEVLLRDLDRPLLKHRLVLPVRGGMGWAEGQSLLLAAEK